MVYFLSLLNAAALYGSLSVLQALLLNRLGLAFAAIPVVAGLGAYAFAAAAIGTSATIQILLLAAALSVTMALLATRLARDHYLLATLAMMECTGASVGMSEDLGGRDGLPLPAVWSVGGSDFEVKMLPLTVGTLILAIAMTRYFLRRLTGVAIDRIREHPDSAVRWFPAQRIRATVVTASLALATAVGAVYLAYYGRVSPSIFSLETALLILAFSAMASHWPELAALAAFLYSVLPYLVTKILPYSQNSTANVIRICWGLLLISAVLAPLVIQARRLRRNRATP